MEKFSELFKSLKDRLSSPLISSFIIAWLVANWRIVIGVIFYKVQELRYDGYKSYFDLIEKNTNLKDNLIWPLGIALFYTFLFPFIRNVIIAFGAWIKRWGNKWRFEISKTEPISLSGYLELTSQNTILEKRLIEAIQAASTDKSEISRLNVELVITSEEKKEIKAQLDRYNKYNQVDTFQGQWRYKAYDQTGASSDQPYDLGDKIEISNTFTISKDNRAIDSYNILCSVANFSNWVLVMTDSNNAIFTWVFRINNNNLNTLNGFNNLGVKFDMVRI